MTAKAELHDAVIQGLIRRIGSQRYDLWFNRNTRLEVFHDRLKVGVPNRFFLEWLEASYKTVLSEVFQELVGPLARIEFVIEPELFQAHRESQQVTTRKAVPNHDRPITQGQECSDQEGPPLPTRTFLRLQDFVVGPSNRLAHAAAVNLLERPEQSVTPLTIYGQPGVGKTHLLEGIYAELRQRRGERAGVFVTAEEFTNRFLPAMQSRQLGPFRRHFREAQALFVDDLHFLAGKEATQREFLHTFESLRKQGRVVAVTSACHPRQLPNFLPELADRLQGGGAWQIELPDEQTRRALLQAKAVRIGLRLPTDVIDFLSVNLRGNVRELEGALNTIRHFCEVQRQAPDLNSVKAALGPMLQQTHRSTHLGDIEKVLCQILGIDRKTLHAKSRARRHAYPRMLGMYLARRCTPSSYVEIGQFFGGRNHSTVIAAEKKVAKWIEDEVLFPFADQAMTWREVVLLVEKQLRNL
ncbi:MAG: DnaA/Hda family protein [Gemmatales bacterium]|nr:DnaA/Hda family protein [Gemmatales bacterium]MDW8387177.1 DnaA/Hda family protein [Gemmatales bacterium]